jgi:hypothetical protein
MKKFKIFNYLKSMTELQGRDDLSFLILTSLDYNMYRHHSPTASFITPSSRRSRSLSPLEAAVIRE